MPTMLKPGQAYKIKMKLESQQSKGSDCLRITNRCFSLEGKITTRFNRTEDLVPKPMRAEEVSGVLKLTGFMPFIETKYVRRGA